MKRANYWKGGRRIEGLRNRQKTRHSGSESNENGEDDLTNIYTYERRTRSGSLKIIQGGDERYLKLLAVQNGNQDIKQGRNVFVTATERVARCDMQRLQWDKR